MSFLRLLKAAILNKNKNAETSGKAGEENENYNEEKNMKNEKSRNK